MSKASDKGSSVLHPPLPSAALIGAVIAAGVGYYLTSSEFVQYLAWDALIAACVGAAFYGMARYGAARQSHWRAFIAGLITFLAGALISTVVAARGGQPTVKTDISDVVTLGAYACMFVAVVRLARARTPHGEYSDMIDALIIVAGVALAMWIAWIGPEVTGTSMHMGERVTAIAFPLLNLVLLTLLLRLTFTPGPRMASYWMLVGALICSLIASQWNLLAFNDGSYGPGHPLEIFRMAAYTLAALAALHPSMAELSRPLPGAHSLLTQPRLLMFGLAALAAPITLLIYEGNWDIDDTIVLIIGASFIFFLMIVRMWTLLGNIRRREEYFRSLVQNSADIVTIMTSEGRISYISDPVTSQLGYQPSDLMGRVAASIAVEEDHKVAQIALQRCLDEGQVRSVDIRVRDAQGAVHWLEMDLLNLLGDRNVRGIVGNFRDITERKESQQQAEVAERSYRDLFNNTIEGIYESLPDGTFTRANPAMARLLGYDSPDDVVENGNAREHWVSVAQREDLLARLKTEGKVENFEMEARTKDGRTIWIQLNIWGTRDPNGELAAIQGLITDVTDRHRALLALRESEERFRSLVQNSSDVIIVLDDAMKITYATPSARDILGRDPDVVLGERFTEWLSGEESDQLDAVVRVGTDSTHTITTRVLTSHGNWLDVEMVVANRLTDPNVRGVILNMRDISERIALQDQLRHQAFHDPLTSLANRALFQDRLEHALERGRRARETSYVLFMDMDDFKRVNDSLGHSVGDEALVATAERLVACTRTSDTVARMGGDEFAVLMEACSLTDATRLAVRVIETMKQPLALSAGHLQLLPSIGIAAASGELEPKDVLRNADVAMYLAKREAQSHYQVFEQEMYTEVIQRIEIETQLRTAMEDEQFEIYLQPIVHLREERTVGAEVLIRWNHPDRGLVFPQDFIAIAEETGQIIEIGRWVFGEACGLLKRWGSDPSMRDLTLTVNLSGRQLRDPSTIADIGAILLRTGADPRKLAMEITESVMAHNVDQTILKLRGMQALGIKLAVDDFGIGYSSLSYLQNFPLDILKIDRSFVQQLADPEGASLAKVIAGIGESLDLTTVGEGIETSEQHQALMALGCELGQGFLFSTALPIPSFEEFVAVSGPRNLRIV